METLDNVNMRIKTAHDQVEKDYKAHVAELASKEDSLRERLNKLNEKKAEAAQANGHVEAAGDDVIEVNAGGKIIAAKRSTFTQLDGTRLEALFSGRWDKELQRDSHGRIFLDVNPVCFEAIVDYLSEVVISSEDNLPSPPSVDDEHEQILRHQLKLFGLSDSGSIAEMPDSKIIKTSGHVSQLHDWLKEDGSDGDFGLLYRSSQDDLIGQAFHSKCDNQGCTLTIIETTCGYFLGGYSNTPWTSNGRFCAANKAFLFVLSGNDITAPVKMKLKNANDGNAVFHYTSNNGPTFGGTTGGSDLHVNGQSSTVNLRFGNTYEAGPLQLDNNGSRKIFQIKEMEVFQVNGTSSWAPAAKAKISNPQVPQMEPVTIFTEAVNEAINAKHESLLQAELEVCHLEDSFNDEHHFISTFASGGEKDVVPLNVSGTTMATKRSTLCIAEDSVLAQQFDDAKWTEQGSNALRVKEWTPDDVSAWAESIEGIQEDAGRILKENKINGCELITLNMEGLKMIGIERAGTLCLLLKEIEKLEKASSGVITLIEHSAYCFGKILDYLRVKQLHSQGLIVEDPALPKVDESQKSRFKKVAKYYFPGESSKFILG